MNQISLVTAPDDVLHDALRITLVQLNPEQTQAVSDVLTSLETIPPMVLYVWQMGNPISWLLDKKAKSNIIIFNGNIPSDGATELIVGYIAAHSNSYYFGTLKDLSQANPRAIYSTEDLKELINLQIEKYGI